MIYLQNVWCDHLDLQKFYVPFIWKRKTFTKIDMNPFINTLTNSFCATFTTPDCPRRQYWTKFPPYCFFAKIIPRLHSSYMFHQSCAFSLVLNLPSAPSKKYSSLLSNFFWIFLAPGPPIHFKDKPHFHLVMLFPFIDSSI